MKVGYYQNLNEKIVVIGGDHHAKPMTDFIEEYLVSKGVEVERVAFDENTKEYISQTIAVTEKISAEPDKYCGIIGCKNGFGVTTVANIFPYVFATRCDDPQQAIDARLVNYINVLTFGSVFVDENEMKQIIDNWFSTNFEENEKNLGRLERLFTLMNHG